MVENKIIIRTYNAAQRHPRATLPLRYAIEHGRELIYRAKAGTPRAEIEKTIKKKTIIASTRRG